MSVVLSRALSHFALPILALPGLLLVSSVSRAEPADWQIDPEHFSISFAASHVGYQQQMGLFLQGAGSVRYDPDSRELISGRVEIQAASIFSNHEARDNHLRGRDFLNADRYPLIVFEATAFEPSDTDDQRGTLTGNLTLLEQTHPVALDVTINKREPYPFLHRRETLGISAHTTLLRSRWGMDYGVANALVGDEVTLRFELEAVRQ